jgi:hypothetical protein
MKPVTQIAVPTPTKMARSQKSGTVTSGRASRRIGAGGSAFSSRVCSIGTVITRSSFNMAPSLLDAAHLSTM